MVLATVVIVLVVKNILAVSAIIEKIVNLNKRWKVIIRTPYLYNRETFLNIGC